VGIELVTLGMLRCVVDGRENTSLASQRQRLAVLLYLAVERDTTREKVMAVFWPDREPERARHALSQTLYELRRALGDEWLKVQADHLIVTEVVEIDAELFENAIDRRHTETALAIYGGEFLAGEYLADTKEFEEWVDERRAAIELLRPKLKQLHRTASRDVVSQLKQSGDLPAALLAARRWVEFDPTEDEAQHDLIELLALTGQRAEALKQYSVYESALKAEGLKPLDDTVELVRMIRKGDLIGPPHSATSDTLSLQHQSTVRVTETKGTIRAQSVSDTSTAPSGTGESSAITAGVRALLRSGVGSLSVRAPSANAISLARQKSIGNELTLMGRRVVPGGFGLSNRLFVETRSLGRRLNES
jgi:DNA-binding SARP family transcriptional activator